MTLFTPPKDCVHYEFRRLKFSETKKNKNRAIREIRAKDPFSLKTEHNLHLEKSARVKG
jgi:hypothetical protein